MRRINTKDLENKVNYLNELTGNALTPYTRTEEGMTSNIGNYHLYWAYGGVTLHQMNNEGGGVTEPLSCGLGTKKELYYAMDSFIAGINLKK